MSDKKGRNILRNRSPGNDSSDFTSSGSSTTLLYSEAAATDPSQKGRPILGSGAKENEGVAAVGSESFPNAIQHNWNLEVPDFVPGPEPVNQVTNGLNNMNMNIHGAKSTHILFVMSSLEKLIQLTSSTDDFDNQLQSVLDSLIASIKSLAAIKEVTGFIFDQVAKNTNYVQVGASMIGFLANRFIVTGGGREHLRYPMVMDNIASFPFYCSLLEKLEPLTVQIKEDLKGKKYISPQSGNFINFISYLYLSLGCIEDPSARSEILAGLLVDFCQLLLQLQGQSHAFATLNSVLSVMGFTLDSDALEFQSSSRNFVKEVNDIYDSLRTAIAYGRCGDPEIAIESIKLLEFRSAQWNQFLPGEGGFYNNTYNSMPDYRNQQSTMSNASGDSHNMTEDMYSDFEQFLIETGQAR